jgi:predicted  nucleic acid-binding Zn-ribbon protein
MFGNRRARAERQLSALAAEIGDLRRQLAVLEEQVGFLEQVRDNAEVDAIVGGDPVSAREHRSAASDLARARRERDEVADRIRDRQAAQDRLLDEFEA